MSHMDRNLVVGLVALVLVATSPITWAQTYSADVPETLVTPNVVATERLGKLHFFDGMPDEETVRKAYDNLDFMRGVETFLSAMPAASLYATFSAS